MTDEKLIEEMETKHAISHGSSFPLGCRECIGEAIAKSREDVIEKVSRMRGSQYLDDYEWTQLKISLGIMDWKGNRYDR